MTANIEQNFKKAGELINSSKSILLTMHERMDGDDGGSILAMHHFLESLGKQVVSVIKYGVPPTLQFLPGSHKIQEEIKHQNFDLLIIFGCADKGRIGNQEIADLKIQSINIDHHPDNTYFGEINIVDSAKSSVAELVYDLFSYNNWLITKEIATCLLTGIITDTGSFMHGNTKDSTLKAAARLLGKGAVSHKIIKHAYKSKDLKILKAWGKAMENSRFDEKNKMIYSVFTEKDLGEIGDLPKAAFEGFVETLNAIPEAKFAMFLKQDGEIIKGSLRSDQFKNIDVSRIAKLFGGGGHRLAAGFSVAGKLIKDETGKWKIV